MSVPRPIIQQFPLIPNFIKLSLKKSKVVYLQASSTASAILPVSGGTACTVVRGTRPLRMSEAKSFMAEADAALYV